MSFVIVGSAGVEVEPEWTPQSTAKLMSILNRIRKLANLTLKMKLNARGLVHDVTAAVRSAEKQIPRLQLGIGLKTSDVARVRAQLAALAKLAPDATMRVKTDIDDDFDLGERLRGGKATVDLDARLSKASLTKIKKQLQNLRGTIDATIDLNQASVAAVKERVDDIDATIEAELDDTQVRAQKSRLKRIFDEVEAAVTVNLNSSIARARLANLTRARIVQIVPVMKRSAYLAVERALDRLSRTSGLKSLNETLKSLGRSFSAITAMKFGLLASSVHVLSAALLVLGGNVLSLSRDMRKLAGVGIVLPGLFAAAAATLTTWVWAFKDMRVQAPELIEMWKQLKVSVAENFWATARQPMLDMANKVMPRLESAWSRAARSMGAEAGYFSDAMGRALGGSFFDRFFADIEEGARRFRPALDPLLQGLSDLMTFGTSQLPRLSTWLSDLASDWGRDLSRMSSDGTFQQWLDDGVQAMRDLKSILGGFFGSLGAIGKAAEAAGGTTLSTLADGMQRLKELLHSDEMQESMTRVFVTARETMSAFFDAAEPGFKKFMTGMTTVAHNIGPMVGEGLGNLVSTIGELLGSDAVTAGLTSLFESLYATVEAVSPILLEFAEPLGVILESVGRLAEAALPALAGILGSVLAAFAPLSERLADLAIAVMPLIEDALSQLAFALSDALSDPAVLEMLVNLFTGITDAIVALLPHLPTLVGLVVGLGNFLADVVLPALPGIIGALNWLIPLLLGVVTAVKLIGPAMMLVKVAAALGFSIGGPVAIAVAAIAAIVAALAWVVLNWDTVKEVAGKVIDWLGNALGGLWDGIVEVFGGLPQFFGDLFSQLPGIVWEFIKGIPGMIWDTLKGIGSFFGDLFSGKAFEGPQVKAPGAAGLGDYRLAPAGSGDFIYSPTINNPQSQSLARDLSNDAARANTYMGWG